MSVRRQLLLFYGVAVLVLLVLSFGAVAASRSVARGEALKDAERTTSRMSRLMVAPLLGDALSGDADKLAELDRAVSARMRDGYLVQVTVWNSDGLVLYADDKLLVGRHFGVPGEVSAAITSGSTSSNFTEQPEASDVEYHGTGPGFVEVYVPLGVPGHGTVAFEAYYDYARVTEIADSLLWQLIPLALVPLILLQLIQLPIATSLGWRIRRQEKERTAWLERALSVSERERMRIAADLHDGSIQDLAGIAYALDALAPGVAERDSGLMQTVQSTLSRANQSLRRLMIEVYPPDLNAAQLPKTIADLTTPLQERQITVSVDAEPLPELPIEALTTLYRVARESLLNILQHAHASAVRVTLAVVPGLGSGQVVILQVEDDGVGLDPAQIDRRAQGHLGLRLLQDRVANLGGTMTFQRGPSGRGLVVAVVLPLDDEGQPGPRPARLLRRPGRWRRPRHSNAQPATTLAPETLTGTAGSGAVAGPFSTAPVRALNLDP